VVATIDHDAGDLSRRVAAHTQDDCLMSITTRAMAFASLWFDAATVDRVFAPLVADWQREWHDAPHRQRSWTLARGSVGFITTCIRLVPRTLLRSTLPGPTWQRASVRMAGFLVVACGLLAAPTIWDASGQPTASVTSLVILLLPAFIASALPFAVGFIVDTIRPQPQATQSQRVAMAQVAMTVSLFVFAFGGWVVPPVNQMFREKTRGYDVPPLAKGVRELTTSELIFAPSHAAEHEPYTGGATRAERVQEEIHNRAFLVTLPILLAWLRWRALDLPRRGWLPLPASVSALLTTVTVATLYLGGWRLSVALNLPQGAGFLLASLALVVWGILTQHRHRALPGALSQIGRFYRMFQNSRIA